MTEPKYREWILNDGGSGWQGIGLVANGPEIIGNVHVIEYSALEAAQKEIEELKNKGSALEQTAERLAMKATLDASSAMAKDIISDQENEIESLKRQLKEKVSFDVLCVAESYQEEVKQLRAEIDRLKEVEWKYKELCK